MNKSKELIEKLDQIKVEEKKSKRIPPESVANNAKRGLELRKEHGRGGTSVGLRRAHQLANRNHVNDTTVKAMHSFFSRHAVDKESDAWKDKSKVSNSRIAHLLWGGDSGKSWAKSERDKLEKSKND